MSALYVALAIAVFAAGFGAAMFGVKTRSVTHIRKVEKQWGKPDASVDGGQINQGLAGLTCDVYKARRTVVCHP